MNIKYYFVRRNTIRKSKMREVLRGQPQKLLIYLHKKAMTERICLVS